MMYQRRVASHGKDGTTRASAPDPISRIFVRHWKAAVVSIVSAFVGAAVSTAMLAEFTTMSRSPSLERLPLFAGYVLTLIVTITVSRRATVILSESVVLHVRSSLIRSIVNVPLRRLEQVGAGSLFAVISSDIGTLSGAASALTVITVQLITLLSILVYIFLLSWKLLVVTVLMLGALIVPMQLTRGIIRPLFRLHRQQQDVVMDGFRTVVEGMKELKLAAGLRVDLTKNIERAGLQGLKAYVRAETIWYVTVPITRGIIYSVILFVIVYGQYRWALPSGTGLAYALAIIALMGPGDALVDIVDTITRARIARQNLDHLGIELSEEAGDLDAAPLPPTPQFGALQLVDVTHTFRTDSSDTPFMLGPIAVTVKQGEILYVVGGNGSGKSTLAKLISGLYTPESGSIIFGGQRITHDNADWFRSHFSAMFVDFMLFKRLHGFNTRDIDKKAADYIRLLELEGKVEVKDSTLSTTTALSQGQRKRVGLLSMMLQERPIMIFDEWAADQDPTFKDFFYRKILPMLKQQGKTLIVITHDDRYFDLADSRIKLENGKLTAESSGAIPTPSIATTGSDRSRPPRKPLAGHAEEQEP